MKRRDIFPIVYLVLIHLFLVYRTEQFLDLVKSYPYQMGFAKIAMLATFGECLRNRIATGYWLPKKIIFRFLIWGIFGLWFTAAFPFIDGGLNQIASQGLWTDQWAALWKSAWLNVFVGFGPFMMFIHLWLDTMLREGFITPWELLGRRETRPWGKIVFWSVLLFWIPAQAVNFSFPPQWRILGAGELAIFLGIILSFASAKNHPVVYKRR